MRGSLIVGFLVLVLGAGCVSSSSAPNGPTAQDLSNTLRAACDLYTSVKPQVMAAKKWSQDHWASVPEDIKPTLLELDGYLPALDQGGLAICDGSEQVLHLHHEVDWDKIVTALIKTVNFAIKLKQQGVI